MPRRPAPEPLSPRALARLRASPRAFVPTSYDLDRGRRDDADRVAEGMPAVGALTTRPTLRRVRDGRTAGGGRGMRRPGLDERRPRPRRRQEPGGRHSRARHPRAWVRVPAAFVGARWQPGRAAVVGVVIVVVLAAAVFGLRVAWAASSSGGTVIAPGGGSRAGPTGVSAGAVPVGASGSAGVPSAAGGSVGVSGSPTSPAAGAAAAAGVVVVHVVGHVRRPGVRSLPLGSRVADAVEAAGGATSKADLSRLNLARVLVDGEQVRVPAPRRPGRPRWSRGDGWRRRCGRAAAREGSSGAKVSLNTADLTALDTLPGVGPVLAQRILDWRAAHGRFTSVDELGEVSGIGEKLLAQLSPLVTL